MINKYKILILPLLSVSKMMNAQPAGVADKLVENGKLNAVIVVALIILAGIFLFLLYIERRVKKLEEDVKN